jgi:hypothetical protein
MNISTEATSLANTRKHVVRGVIDVEDLKAFLGGVYRNSDQASTLHALWDLRDVDFSSISVESARAVMGFVAQRRGEGDGRVAVVVSSDLEFSKSRTYQSILDGAISGKVEVFRHLVDAEKWIGSESQA